MITIFSRQKKKLVPFSCSLVFKTISKIDKLSDVKNCCRVFKFNLCDVSKCIIPHKSINIDNSVCIRTKTKKNLFIIYP